jgi:membrane protease YdiL (CAAX protease family)
MTSLSSLKAFGTALLLFAAVYAPTFGFVSAIRPTMQAAVPLVVAISLAIALLLIALLARFGRASNHTFGFKLPNAKILAVSLLIAGALAATSYLVLKLYPEPGPFAKVPFSFAQVLVYFAIGAAVQEEVIFRGLIQTMVQRVASTSAAPLHVTPHFAIAIGALLFGAIHLAVGPITAAFAVVLGLLAGYARNQSQSLLPAVLCHSVFNMPGVLAALNQ